MDVDVVDLLSPEHESEVWIVSHGRNVDVGMVRDEFVPIVVEGLIRYLGSDAPPV